MDRKTLTMIRKALPSEIYNNILKLEKSLKSADGNIEYFKKRISELNDTISKQDSIVSAYSEKLEQINSIEEFNENIQNDLNNLNSERMQYKMEMIESQNEFLKNLIFSMINNKNLNNNDLIQ